MIAAITWINLPCMAAKSTVFGLLLLAHGFAQSPHTLKTPYAVANIGSANAPLSIVSRMSLLVNRSQRLALGPQRLHVRRRCTSAKEMKRAIPNELQPVIPTRLARSYSFFTEPERQMRHLLDSCLSHVLLRRMLSLSSYGIARDLGYGNHQTAEPAVERLPYPSPQVLPTVLSPPIPLYYATTSTSTLP